jgi:hypothetical protein
MRKFARVATYDFEPHHHEFLLNLDLQESIIPRHVEGPVLFTVARTLDADGVYRGSSTVRCYEFESIQSKPRMRTDDAS